MPSRRAMLLSFAVLTVFSAPGFAAEFAPFTPEAFDAAQAAGRPILVDISADWCPTCKAQAPIIKDVTSRAAFKQMIVFEVDFDTQTSVVRSLGARMQSTLIVFKGRDEIARSVGETDPGAIEAQLVKAVTGS